MTGIFILVCFLEITTLTKVTLTKIMTITKLMMATGMCHITFIYLLFIPNSMSINLYHNQGQQQLFFCNQQYVDDSPKTIASNKWSLLLL